MKPNVFCSKCGHNYNSEKFPKCPNCPKSKNNELDLNKDGKVDKKDRSLAGRVLGKSKKSSKKKRR